MNLSSALLKQILILQDSETWSACAQHYFPDEYHKVYTIIKKHYEEFHRLPTFEDLKFEVRDPTTRDKIYAIETIETDAEPDALLQYLKNEYTQQEVFTQLEDLVDNSIAFESAEETVEHLHRIVMDIEEKVDLQPPQESMQRITLFESDEDFSRYTALGLNSEYDSIMQFAPKDYILIGGRRGGAKSVTCHNIANNVVASGRSAIYFTIEMDARQILQRACATALSIPYTRLRTKNLSINEWEKVATWWANRFVEGQQELREYEKHRDFGKLHTSLITKYELQKTPQLDVVYDPGLTLTRIRAELDKKINNDSDVGIIIVDYLNQVRRSNVPNPRGLYDWTEQIEVSKALKSMAQEYNTTVFSPYQTDTTGEARFAKGILDSADAAFTIDTYTELDECITFNCAKMRSGPMKSFTSKMDWDCLKIGPESALTPKEQEGATGEEINDI